jgi:teichuronic acid exporter
VNIGKKLLSGSFWNSIGEFGQQFINLLLTLVLARLLAPEDFGLVGIVAIFTSFLGYFTEFGLTPSLIKKQKVDELDTQTVFWTTMAFSVLMFVLTYFGAPLIGRFYEKPELVSLTRILFINFLIMPFGFIPKTLETIKLKFDKVALSQIIGLLISGIVSVVMALRGAGVWALVVQQLVRVTVMNLILLRETRWLPKFIFSWSRLTEHLRFGIHYTINNLVTYASSNLDFFLVGKLIGPAPLGLYTMSFRVSKYPVQKVWQIIGRILFPAFSKLGEDREKLVQYYARIGFVLSLLLIPALLIGILAMPELVRLVLSEKWIDTIPVIRIFLIYLMVNALSIADEPMLITLGKLGFINLVKILTSIIMGIAGIYAIGVFGLTGMAWVYSLVTIGYLLIFKLAVFYWLEGSFKESIKFFIQMLAILVPVSILFVLQYFLKLRYDIPDLLYLAGLGSSLLIYTLLYLSWRGVLDISKKKLNLSLLFKAEEKTNIKEGKE